MEVKKVVLKLNFHDNRDKQKAMKAVSCLPGIESIAVDLKEGKMTVIGETDPVQIVSKLRKQWCPQILTVGPKEEKKDDTKKDGKKDEKKDDKKDEKKDDKKEDNKKGEKEQLEELIKAYKAYNPPVYYCVQSMEENPNACVIS